MTETQPRPSPVARPPVYVTATLRRITMRKWEIVVYLYHDGLTYEETAERLGISVRTVTRHIEQIASRRSTVADRRARKSCR